MQLQCPRCGQIIPGSELDVARGVGVCRPCAEIVPFPAELASALPITPFSPSTGRVYRPDSYSLVERTSGDTWEAVLAPNRLVGLPLLFFACLWDAFMVAWYGIALTSGLWPMALFGLLHLAAGVYITHKAIVTLVNTRRLVIDRTTVAWRSGPVPDRGTVSLPIDQVLGFSAKVTLGKTTAYRVAMNLEGGSFRELDVQATDQASAEYAAATFQDALATAKRQVADVPYRD